MPDKPIKDIHHVDLHVGQRLRARRSALGLDQESVASSVGVSFQQIQKYERGTNRVSASRLFDLSKVLNVPIDHFFKDLHEADRVIDQYFPDQDPMGREDTKDLAEMYWALDEEIRTHFIKLLVAMAKGEEN